MRSSFFTSVEQDEYLEKANSVFWENLISCIKEDCEGKSPISVLDIGCHYGGLLCRGISEWHPQRVWGIEPIKSARERAAARLSSLAPEVRILDVVDWIRVPALAFDLVLSHEELYLEPDLQLFMANIERVLSPAGSAYIVLGCHAENPVWSTWKPLLETTGHRVYDHRPMDILAAGSQFGLIPALRPLRGSGWILHDPTRSQFSFPSAGMMIDHHFKYKLLFRMTRR